MVKKGSPKEIIESTPYPHIEHAFYRDSGEIQDITVYSSSETQSRESPPPTLRKYTHIHTHPTAIPKFKRSLVDTLFPGLFHPESIYEERKEISHSALPSPPDMKEFLRNTKEQTSAIAVREPDTGKVRGYTVVRKTKSTPNARYGLYRDIKEYRAGYREYSSFDKLCQKYHLQHRFVPAEGYELNETKTQFVKKKTPLEQRLSVIIGIAGLVSSLFFLGSNATGNVIGSSEISSGSLVGSVLFAVGILGVFFYFYKEK